MPCVAAFVKPEAISEPDIQLLDLPKKLPLDNLISPDIGLDVLTNGFPTNGLEEPIINGCSPVTTPAPIDSPVHSPPAAIRCTTVLTSGNGFWKQEDIIFSNGGTTQSIEQLKRELHKDEYEDSFQADLSFLSSDFDSDDDIPCHKPQPFFDARGEDSSSDDQNVNEETQNSTNQQNGVNTNSKTFSCPNTKIGTGDRGGKARRTVLTAYARAKILAALKSKKRNQLNATHRSKLAELAVDRRQPWMPGDLVWARPKHPMRLSWWPAIVVQRPQKPLEKFIRLQLARDTYRDTIPAFGVCLFGPILADTVLPIPQTRLRSYAGRDEFDLFMRDTVLVAKNKIKALQKFVVQPSLQSFWQLARETADAAQLMKLNNHNRLSLFPWMSRLEQCLDQPNIPRSRHTPFPVFPRTIHKRKHRRAHASCNSSSASSFSSSSEASEQSDSDTTEVTASTTGRVEKLPKYARMSTAPVTDAAFTEAKTRKDLATHFEYDRLHFMLITPQRLLICSVCGQAGEVANTTSNPTDADPTSTSRPSSAVSIKPRKTSSDFHIPYTPYPLIVECLGACGNFMHPNCATTIQVPVVAKVPKVIVNTSTESTVAKDSAVAVVSNQSCPTLIVGEEETKETNAPVDQGTEVHAKFRSASVCDLCLASERRCFICNNTEPCAPVVPTACRPTPIIPTKPDESSPAPVDTPMDTVAPEVDEPSLDKTEKPFTRMIRCSMRLCHRWFHPDCLRVTPFSSLVRDRRCGAFSCPAHTCLACAVESPGTLPRPAARYVRCFLCPVAYHPGDWCVPSGSKELAPNWIICPRHAPDDHLAFRFIPSCLNVSLPLGTLSTIFRPTNVSWCFICSKGGRIICCELCPASFHEECLKIDEVPDKFICEDCANGRLPRHGEIVWARLPPNLHSTRHGVSRALTAPNPNGTDSAVDYASLTVGMYWWPGEVVHPRHMPADTGSLMHAITDGAACQTMEPTVGGGGGVGSRTAADDHALGLLPIRLFGLTATRRVDHPDNMHHTQTTTVLPIVLWTTRARLFPYEEGDDKREAESSSDSESIDSEEGSLGGDQKQRRRRSCDDDDGEDEDPLLQLGQSNESPTSKNTNGITADPLNTSTSQSDGVKSPSMTTSLRPRSTRRQQLRSLKTTGGDSTKPSESAPSTPVDPVLAAQRKQVYAEAVKQAAEGWSGRRDRVGQLLGRTRRPDYYKPIKVNWPLGSVRVYRLTDISEAPRCECKPNSDSDHCGPRSGCINRELHYECLPSACPNGDKCENQRFTKRLHPAQRPFWSGSERGWGLKTLVPISEGEFVNEYVGDLIDEEEANRRLRFAHENNVTNYYMMKLDPQRIIDAGPKGNLSRFMNHSCDPNLNTQKWTVNGDNRIGLFAIREIPANAELTFNYNFVALGQERVHCRCGASNCTGLLGAATIPSNGARNSDTTDDATNQNGTAVAITRSKRGNTQSSVNTTDSNPTTGNGEGNSTKSLATIASSVSTANPSAGQESALVRSDRHERMCYRCHSNKPPVKYIPEMIDPVMSIKPPGLLIQSPAQQQQSSKRGLERELEKLVADSNKNGSPVKCNPLGASETGATRTTTTALTAAASSAASGGKNRADLAHQLVHCTKPDCPKVYHLECLDLDSVANGRWFCPWHHCDVCGRPAHIFCGLCPSSFCLAHMEGSFTVLSPAKSLRASQTHTTTTRRRSMRVEPDTQPVGTNRLGRPRKVAEPTVPLVQVVCMSHTDLIRSSLVSSPERQPLASLDPLSNQESRSSSMDAGSHELDGEVTNGPVRRKRLLALRSTHNTPQASPRDAKTCGFEFSTSMTMDVGSQQSTT